MKMRLGRLRQLVACALTGAMLLTATTVAAPIVYGYCEGLAQATEDGLWGFVNANGQVVIEIKYQSVLDFNLGTAMVRSGEKMGLIRQDGTYLLKPEYDTLENLGYGLYIAQKGDLWGVVSILPFEDGFGGQTQEFYTISYDHVRVSQLNGLDVLMLTKDGKSSGITLSRLPQLMLERKVPSAQFPLVKGRLPSFADVSSRDWYAVWVDLAYNVNLMQGTGEGGFSPASTLTVAEVLKLAAYMESQYQGDDFHLQPNVGKPWYRSAVTYCEASGIISPGEFDNVERPVTRAEMAHIFAATALARGMESINSLGVIQAAVPDVKAGDYAAEAIYSLYAKGILTGTDGKLTFQPNATLTRAEAAAIVARMARAEQRMRL